MIDSDHLYRTVPQMTPSAMPQMRLSATSGPDSRAGVWRVPPFGEQGNTSLGYADECALSRRTVATFRDPPNAVKRKLPPGPTSIRSQTQVLPSVAGHDSSSKGRVSRARRNRL